MNVNKTTNPVDISVGDVNKTPSTEEELDQIITITDFNVNELEEIIKNHARDIRLDIASQIAGGPRSEAVTNVITLKTVLQLIEAYKDNAIDKVLDELEEKAVTPPGYAEVKVVHLGHIQAARNTLKEKK